MPTYLTPRIDIAQAVKNRQKFWRVDNSSFVTGPGSWGTSLVTGIRLTSVPYAIAVGPGSAFDKYTITYYDPIISSSQATFPLYIDRPFIFPPAVNIRPSDLEDGLFTGYIDITPDSSYVFSSDPENSGYGSTSYPNVGFGDSSYRLNFDIVAYLSNELAIPATGREPWRVTASDYVTVSGASYSTLFSPPLLGRKHIDVWLESSGANPSDIQILGTYYYEPAILINNMEVLYEGTLDGSMSLHFENKNWDYLICNAKPNDGTSTTLLYSFNLWDDSPR